MVQSCEKQLLSLALYSLQLISIEVYISHYSVFPVIERKVGDQKCWAMGMIVVDVAAHDEHYEPAVEKVSSGIVEEYVVVSAAEEAVQVVVSAVAEESYVVIAVEQAHFALDSGQEVVAAEALALVLPER